MTFGSLCMKLLLELMSASASVFLNERKIREYCAVGEYTSAYLRLAFQLARSHWVATFCSP